VSEIHLYPLDHPALLGERYVEVTCSQRSPNPGFVLSQNLNDLLLAPFGMESRMLRVGCDLQMFRIDTKRVSTHVVNVMSVRDLYPMQHQREAVRRDTSTLIPKDAVGVFSLAAYPSDPLPAFGGLLNPGPKPIF